MNNNPGSSGNDYLKNLFAQTEAKPISDEFVRKETLNPALTGESIIHLLSQMNLGFLTQYLVQGDTNRMFSKDEDSDYLFFDYECADTQSAEMADPFPGEPHDEDDEPNPGENFGIDLGSPYLLSAGLNIIFNEDTAQYQLDWMYVRLGDNDEIELSCAKGNEKEIYNFLVIFSAVAMKIVNGQDVGRADIALMEGFCNRPGEETPESDAPAGPQPL